jgi:hypothetical protein
MSLLTVQDSSHILDKTVQDFKSMRSGRPSLFLGQPVQPLKDSLDVVLSQKLLDEFYCAGAE